VPSQFAVGKSRIIHKPTTATFSFEIGEARRRYELPDFGKEG